MNRTYRKLKKLQSMAIIVSDESRKMAISKSRNEDDYRQYLTIDVEWVEKGGMPEVSIYRRRVNQYGLTKSVSSRTDIPHDKLFEAWTYVDEMKDSYHEEFSGVTSLIRAAMRYGISNLKFGTYIRKVESTDYLDFELR